MYKLETPRHASNHAVSDTLPHATWYAKTHVT